MYNGMEIKHQETLNRDQIETSNMVISNSNLKAIVKIAKQRKSLKLHLNCYKNMCDAVHYWFLMSYSIS